MKNLAVKTSLLALIILVFAISSVYSSENPKSISTNGNEQLKNELKGIDGKTAMQVANKWRSKKIGVVTFVTPDMVNFKFKDGETVSLPVPEDVMVVSVAPYINTTHPCATHYMSKCDAELKNEDIRIAVYTADGKILINKTMKTGPFGFLDLWLPRNQEMNITVHAKGKNATGKISTYRNSKTCDTTLKLE